jgi:hypothetical protein
MTARCTNEPVSWLRLERYHLGEVDDAERARIASHLASCAACAACLASIEKDDAVLLAPLPPRLHGGQGGRGRLVAFTATAAALALAAAALLGVGRGWLPGHAPEEPSRGSTASRVKGNAIAFTLVRDDDERIAEAGGIYRDGDRFKALVTCPPGASLAFDLVVFDAQGAAFPLSPASGFACGNDAPLPGAFRLTGNENETVCLVWSEDGQPDRSAIATGRAALGERSLCKTLAASAPERHP